MSSPQVPTAAFWAGLCILCSGWMSSDKEPVMVLDCTASGLLAKQEKKKIFSSAGRQEAALRPQVARPDICMLITCVCTRCTHKPHPRRRVSLSI